MRVGFVMGGGGNLGALQVGMLRALAERSITPSIVVGCSVGALNGAAYCQEPTLAGIAKLEELWHSLDGKDVLPTGWVPTAVQLARRGDAIHTLAGLRRVIESILTVEQFEELAIPLHCVATALVEAREEWFTTGSIADAIVASSAARGGSMCSMSGASIGPGRRRGVRSTWPSRRTGSPATTASSASSRHCRRVSRRWSSPPATRR